ncbi:unnamed protein product [Allacma fusca]|uniref:Uncharacterized protein n=1 Tax=Allacma fusca TaxID=39272 RepID=A0A8J2LC04_9HEXA|nr:unnamed protein product [Allacma fusca]
MGNQGVKQFDPSLIFLIVLNFTYFSLFSPFTAKYCPVQEQWVRRTNRVLVAGIHICILLSVVEPTLKFTDSGKSDFHVWSNRAILFLWAMYIITVMFTLWLKQQAVVDFLNGFQKLCSYLTNNGLILVRRAEEIAGAAVFPICVFLYGGAQMFSVKNYMPLNNSVGEDDMGTNESLGWRQCSPFNDLWHTVKKVTFTFAVAFTIIGHGILISLTISTLIVVRAFVSQVQKLEKDANSLVKVLDALEKFSLFFENTSNIFSLLMCTNWLAFIPTFALDISFAFGEGTSEKAKVGSNVVIFFSTLFFAANAHSQIKSIQRWIQHSLSKARQTLICYVGLHLRVNLIMEQINSNEFSFSGHLFLITYGFIGSTCGLILTYAIVVRGETY